MVRTVLFWLHLAAGVLAGAVILLMSATGVALTYERQLNAWSTSHLRSVAPSAGAVPLSLEVLVERVSQNKPDVSLTGVTVSAAPGAAVTLMADPAPLFVDAYTGRELGERRGAGLRAFLSTMRGWHRWLAMDGENRAVGKAITGWANLLFLFIVVSGLYLWLPRTWRWLQLRQALWFKRQYGTSKARDFNWHHVIGIWSAIPLFVIVLGAVPMSFPWANDALYRLVGDEPPARGRVAAPGGRDGRGGPATPAAAGSRTDVRGERGRSEDANRRATPPSFAGLDVAFARARSESSDWRTISVRVPRRAEEPLAFTVDSGDGGQPQRRASLTLTRAGEVVSRETFADQSRGRQLRSVLRFAHTGEVFGIIGQTIAGLATTGSVVMVWTGLALSWRRLFAWRARRRERSLPASSRAALADVSPLSPQEFI